MLWTNILTRLKEQKNHLGFASHTLQAEKAVKVVFYNVFPPGFSILIFLFFFFFHKDASASEIVWQKQEWCTGPVVH